MKKTKTIRRITKTKRIRKRKKFNYTYANNEKKVLDKKMMQNKNNIKR